MDDGRYVAISISRELYEKVKKKVEESEGAFTSVEEYVEFVLKELLEEETPFTPNNLQSISNLP